MPPWLVCSLAVWLSHCGLFPPPLPAGCCQGGCFDRLDLDWSMEQVCFSFWSSSSTFFINFVILQSPMCGSLAFQMQSSKKTNLCPLTIQLSTPKFACLPARNDILPQARQLKGLTLLALVTLNPPQKKKSVSWKPEDWILGPPPPCDSFMSPVLSPPGSSLCPTFIHAL